MQPSESNCLMSDVVLCLVALLFMLMAPANQGWIYCCMRNLDLATASMKPDDSLHAGSGYHSYSIVQYFDDKQRKIHRQEK